MIRPRGARDLPLPGATAILLAGENGVARAVGIISFAATMRDAWMEGVQLFAVYVILGMAFFFLPV